MPSRVACPSNLVWVTPGLRPRHRATPTFGCGSQNMEELQDMLKRKTMAKQFLDLHSAEF